MGRGFIEQRSQAIESLLPVLPPFGDPLLQCPERLRLELAGPHTSHFPGAYDTRPFEHLHMLQDGCE